MKSDYSPAYGVQAVTPGPGATPDEVIEYCRKVKALRTDYDDTLLYCVVLRGDVGPELWSEEAIRRMLK